MPPLRLPPGRRDKMAKVLVKGKLVEQLTAWETAVFVLFQLGGGSSPCDTEDIAARCFDLAPHLFSWDKYKFPSRETARATLARLRTKLGFVSSLSGKWVLTQKGLGWLRENEQSLFQQLGDSRVPADREYSRKLQVFLSNPLFIKFRKNPSRFSPTPSELSELFKCRVDSSFSDWSASCDEAIRLARISKEEKLIEFLLRCQTAANSLERGNDNVI